MNTEWEAGLPQPRLDLTSSPEDNNGGLSSLIREGVRKRRAQADDSDTGLRQRQGGPQCPSSRRSPRRGEREQTTTAKYLDSIESPRALSTTHPSLAQAMAGGWLGTGQEEDVA